MEEKEFDKYINPRRIRESSVPRGEIDEFYSDRSRVLYCSSFRRLQQKAQVFSLEPNASVRTRLTHSLEVSDIGRTLSSLIVKKLIAPTMKLTTPRGYELVTIVETACLLHDIGNPPFGHFGEDAIKDWARKSLALDEKKKEFEGDSYTRGLFDGLMSDFYEFDGNPQGFRVVTKLHRENNDNYGLNLSYSTLMSILKYSRAAGEDKSQIEKEDSVSGDIIKKAGYFQSEKETVDLLYREMDIMPHHRYPFTYIVEAADDIAYCMSDIADGIEKGILTEKTFIDEFKEEWCKSYPEEELPIEIPDRNSPCLKGFSMDISVPWSKNAINEAVSYFMDHLEEIKQGTAGSLINKNGRMGKVFETIKKVSRKCLYASIKAESIEITGYAVITGILNRFERLIKLSTEEFGILTKKNVLIDKNYETRLFHLIGERYIEAYKDALCNYSNQEKDFEVYELWLRIHLIVDQISGMTDDFALETYQMLEGIQVVRS